MSKPEIDGAGAARALALSRDGALAAVGGWYDDLRVYTLPPVLLLRPLGGRDKPTALAFFADGRLAAGYEPGRLVVWDAKSGERVAERKAHKGAISAVATSPRGSTVVTA